MLQPLLIFASEKNYSQVILDYIQGIPVDIMSEVFLDSLA